MGTECRLLLLHFVLQAIAQDVGPREMTVRQMLHSAALRSRQPSMTPAAADQLVQLSASLPGSPLERVPSTHVDTSTLLQQKHQHPSHGHRGDVERGLPLESVGSNTGGSFRQTAAAAARLQAHSEQPTAAEETQPKPGSKEP